MKTRYLLSLIVIGIYLSSTIVMADDNKSKNGFLNISLNNNTPLLDGAKSVEVTIIKIDSNLENISWKNNVSLPFYMSFSLHPGIYKVYVKKDSSTIIEFNNDDTGYTIDYGKNVNVPLTSNSGYLSKNSDSSQDNRMHLYTINWPFKDILSDIPWRIDAEKNIPIIYMIKDAKEWPAYLRTITIFDDRRNTLVYTHSIERTIAQDLWHSYDILSPSMFSEQNGSIRIHVKFDIAGEIDIHNYYTTYISQYNLPRFDNWYYGDTHYHSNYTDNVLEFGSPIQSTVLVGKAMGLKWITVTDHSFDLDNTKWNNLVKEGNYYSDSNFRILPSEEISCTVPSFSQPQQYNHYLSYGITQFIPGGEYEDFTGSHYNCSELVSIVNGQNGFGYPAHPMDQSLFDIFRVPWKDYNLDFRGLEIWNGNNIPKLEEGLNKWKELLSNGRKIFVEAGSDAHGEFNSGMGKVRTLVYSPSLNNSEILSALRNGHSIMTNGPIVIFDVNGTMIGDTRNITIGDNINLNIMWNSTPEFGLVNNINIIKGTVGNREIIERQIYPNNYSGNERIVMTPSQNVYYRLEAMSTDGYRVYTNPIWINIVPRMRKNWTNTGAYTISGAFKDQISDIGNVTGSTNIQVGAGHNATSDGSIDRNEAVQAVIDYFSGNISRQDAMDVVILHSSHN